MKLHNLGLQMCNVLSVVCRGRAEGDVTLTSIWSRKGALLAQLSSCDRSVRLLETRTMPSQEQLFVDLDKVIVWELVS